MEVKKAMTNMRHIALLHVVCPQIIALLPAVAGDLITTAVTSDLITIVFYYTRRLLLYLGVPRSLNRRDCNELRSHCGLLGITPRVRIFIINRPRYPPPAT